MVEDNPHAFDSLKVGRHACTLTDGIHAYTRRGRVPPSYGGPRLQKWYTRRDSNPININLRKVALFQLSYGCIQKWRPYGESNPGSLLEREASYH
jgi:hypothetical protein